jgi:hypothetical protein
MRLHNECIYQVQQFERKQNMDQNNENAAYSQENLIPQKYATHMKRKIKCSIPWLSKTIIRYGKSKQQFSL